MKDSNKPLDIFDKYWNGEVGITEKGDAGIDFSWISNLKSANIIITKHMTADNAQLISALLENKHRIILHVTCTGLGGTPYEPNVPTPDKVYAGLENLITLGFPVSQIVLRIDPIIPNNTGLKLFDMIYNKFTKLGITRVRYSIMDIYGHVKDRFIERGLPLPFNNFQADRVSRKVVMDYIDILRMSNPEISIFSCAEKDDKYQQGCVSEYDLMLLGLTYKKDDPGLLVMHNQRRDCNCIKGKVEIMKGASHPCSHNCVYCYWKG